MKGPFLSAPVFCKAEEVSNEELSSEARRSAGRGQRGITVWWPPLKTWLRTWMVKKVPEDRLKWKEVDIVYLGFTDKDSICPSICPSIHPYICIYSSLRLSNYHGSDPMVRYSDIQNEHKGTQCLPIWRYMWIELIYRNQNSIDKQSGLYECLCQPQNQKEGTLELGIRKNPCKAYDVFSDPHNRIDTTSERECMEGSSQSACELVAFLTSSF